MRRSALTYPDPEGRARARAVPEFADKSEASAAFPLLDRVKSFPTTIFFDGDVHTVYSGYSGPATGEAHERLKREFDSVVLELLGDGD